MLRVENELLLPQILILRFFGSAKVDWALVPCHDLTAPYTLSPDLLSAFAHFAHDLFLGFGCNLFAVAVDVLRSLLDYKQFPKCSSYSLVYFVVLWVLKPLQLFHESVLSHIVEEVLLKILLHLFLLIVDFIKDALIEGVECATVVVDARSLLVFLTAITDPWRNLVRESCCFLPTLLRSLKTITTLRIDTFYSTNLVKLGNNSRSLILLIQLCNKLATAP